MTARKTTWIAGLALLLAAGCGSGRLQISGKLLDQGKPLVKKQGQHLSLTFHRLEDPAFPADDEDDDDTRVYHAGVTDDGQFQVAGPEGDGIPPGRYRVAVKLRRGRQPAQDQPGMVFKVYHNPDDDLLGGKFTEVNSPIVRSFTRSEDITIDLAKPTEGAEPAPTPTQAQASAGG